MATRILALILALFVTSTAMAEKSADQPAQLGRLAAISGAVSYHSTADAAPGEAAVNLPLTTGNRIATLPRAHAAIDIAAGRFYLDGDSELRIGTLGPGMAAVTLEKGAVILRILPGGAGQVFVIDTPSGKLRADQPGYFEVEAAADSVVISALEGGAQFNDSTVLAPGARLTVNKNTAVIGAASKDDFVRRIEAEIAEAGDDKLEAPSHVSPQTTGFPELQRHGLWVSTEQYGWAWEPMVGSDWKPFQDGRWVEIAPFGRTWIDNAAWGFAPAHYGRWAEVNGRWVWVPGSAGQETAGSTGEAEGGRANWVALGPEEPHFTAPPVIVNRVRVIYQPPKIVNVTTVNNTTNVTNVVHVDRQPSVVFFGPLVPVTPPTTPPPTPAPTGLRNTTGLGAAGTPIQGGVTFPGQ